MPQRADGVELVGEFKHSGYKEAPWLVRRVDGQTVQLTWLLYVVLEAIDGRRDIGAIAAVASSALNGKRASADAIRFLIDERLRPLGLLKRPDGSNPVVRRSDPLLAVRPRIELASERVSRLLTAPFAVLFRWPIVPLVTIAFAMMMAWLLFVRGVGQSVREVLYEPELLLLTAALTALSAGFHEFGHAAACRFAGARPGVIGAGLYLVWPVFYTDVTDSYRLNRAGRLCVDLGGVYFNAIFALGTFALSLTFGWEAALVLIPLQLFQMLRQLLPMLKFDGYHILADLTGVPDLYARTKPILLSFVPGLRRDERVTALKPWVRFAVTAWTLVIIPLLVITMATLLIGLPRMLATAWDSLSRQWDGVSAAFDEGELTMGLAGLLTVAALILPAAGGVYSLLRFGRRTVVGTWRRTDGRPLIRAGAVGGLAAVAVGLAVLWWPNGEYRPIRRDESMTVPDLMADLPATVSGRQPLSAAPTIEQLPDPGSMDAPARPGGGGDAPEPGMPSGSSGVTPGAPASPTPTPIAPATATTSPASSGATATSALNPTATPTAADPATTAAAPEPTIVATAPPAPEPTAAAPAPEPTAAAPEPTAAAPAPEPTAAAPEPTTAAPAPAPAATTPPDAATLSTTATEETTP